MALVRSRWRWGRWGRWAAAALALCAVQAAWRVRESARRALRLPLPPDALAHRLADFAVLARLHPTAGEWTIETEGGNYTAWWYEAAYACGRRCAGRARVSAAAEGAPRHGPAAAHRVTVRYSECGPPSILPWPHLCDEWETDSVVRAGPGGAVLQEAAACRCGALRAAAGRCRAALHALLQRRHAELTQLFAEFATHGSI